MHNGRPRLSWEETALKLAFNIADYRSQDPNVQVGCCIIENDGQIILGYNGPPPKINIDWSDRDERRSKIIHAEENALYELKDGNAKIFAVTHSPCPACMRIIAKKGIKRVYFKIEREDLPITLSRAKEFGIEMIKLT
jgi:dCMP deaminase